MKLGELLQAGEVEETQGNVERAVAGLAYDSRQVKPGFVFFAVPGAKSDGHEFIPDALARGAAAVVVERRVPQPGDAAAIRVHNVRRAMGHWAARFYGYPSRKPKVAGVTGTNGKTTVTYILESIFRAAGMAAGVVGTVNYRYRDCALPAPHTTPESVDLQRLLAEMTRAGVEGVAMEVSSHALELERVRGIDFDAAIFTNLTRDHLDFHRTMEDYFAAKQLLFTGTGAPAPRFAAINRDDEYGARIKTGAETQTVWYGMGKDATVRARHISSSFGGLRFEVQAGSDRINIESALIGRINVYNILAACCAGLSYGLPADIIARGIAQCRAVPGRFERVDEGQPFVVVVDYAHTDDALRNVISMARSLEPKRVVTLFGCGGDRDRTKRPIMGQVAAELSDFVVLTSDNPRSEDPIDIMNDVLVGLRRKDTPCLVEPDRATAIRRAIEEARPGDILILAGKGHETYQVLKDRTIPFDDREVAREVLRGFGYRPRPDASQ